MESFVLDTNIFFNLEAKTGLGENPKEVITNLTSIIKDLYIKKKALFYMPFRIVEELYSFVSPEEDYVKDFIGSIRVKSPDIMRIQIPVELFYKIVEEMRERSYKGLKIAEEIVDEAFGFGKELSKKYTKIERQKKVGFFISRLRERYRNATRTNIIDSLADLDLIVLAYELEGFVVTSDEGVLRWGRFFGVRELSASSLKHRLLSL